MSLEEIIREYILNPLLEQEYKEQLRVYMQQIDQIESNEQMYGEVLDYLQKISEYTTQQQQKPEKYIVKSSSQKSTIENPYKKCMLFQQYLEGNIAIPTYLFQFLEVVCLELEKDAKEILQQQQQYNNGDSKTITNNNSHPNNNISANNISANIIQRTLPITIDDLPCGTIETKKKNILSKHYIQIDKNKRDTQIYYIRDIKAFKNYLKQIKLNKLKYYEQYTHADYGDQDFKYISALYKIVYKLQTPIISNTDKDYIAKFYAKYSEYFTRVYKQQSIHKNIKKLFLIIKQIISYDKQLLDKYRDLFYYIPQESGEMNKENNEIFQQVISYIKENYKGFFKGE